MSERTQEQWQTDKTEGDTRADGSQQDNAGQQEERTAASGQGKRHGKRNRTRGVAGLLGDYTTSAGADQEQSSGDRYSDEPSSRGDDAGAGAQPEPVERAERESAANETPTSGASGDVRTDAVGRGAEAHSEQAHSTEATHQQRTDESPEDSGVLQQPASATSTPASAEPARRDSDRDEQNTSKGESRHVEHGRSFGGQDERAESAPPDGIEERRPSGPRQREPATRSDDEPARRHGARAAQTRTTLRTQPGSEVVEDHTSGSRPIPAGDQSPMARGSGERVVKVSYYVPEDHTYVLDEMRAQLKRRYRYTPRQASQSNLIALAIERLYEDLMGEPFTDDTDGGP